MQRSLGVALVGALLLQACSGSESAESPQLGQSRQALGAPRPIADTRASSPQVAQIVLGTVGDKVIIEAGDQQHGNELWVVNADGGFDPSVGGKASFLRDVNPGYGIGLPTNGFTFASFGSLGVFWADDGAHGLELWKTDGTSAGTALVKDLVPGALGIGSTYSGGPPLVATSNAAYWITNEYVGGGNYVKALNRTDGTAAGTFKLKQGATSGESFTALTPSGPNLYFVFSDANGIQLWATDGTTQGTAAVPVTGGPLTALSELTDVDGVLYFAGTTSGTGINPWRCPSPQAGAQLVKAIEQSGSYPSSFVSWNGAVYFIASDAAHGREIWKTDGTANGTQLVTDANIPFVLAAGVTDRLVASTTRLFIAPGSSSGPSTGELWTSDGTDAGTVLVTNSAGEISDLTAFKDKALFRGGSSSGSQTWVTDGTPAGTLTLSSSNQKTPAPFLKTPDEAFFVTGGANAGVGFLQATDGTVAGTIGFNGFTSKLPSILVTRLKTVGSAVLLPLTDNNLANRLWRSDGTDAGTYPLVNSVVAGTTIVTEGDVAWFTGYTAVPSQGLQLYQTDGTAAGTKQVSNVPNGILAIPIGVAGGRVVFSGGPSLPKALMFSEADGGLTTFGNVNPTEASTWNGKVLFLGRAADGGAGPSVWLTDGTVSGTVELVTPTTDVGTLYATPYNGSLYFLGPNFELWKTDGTAAGTTNVSGASPKVVGQLTVANGWLYFAGSTPNVEGTELWRTDGTALGTQLVKDLNPGPQGSNPARLAEWQGRVVFTADDGTGTKLWLSDGTAQGTTLVTDTLLGFAPYSQIESLERVFAVPNGPLLFPAGDEHGNELWSSYGTPATTNRISDFRVGPDSSNPATFALLGDKAFFYATADDGSHVYVIDVERDGGIAALDGGSGAGGGAGGGSGGGSGGGGGGDVTGAGGTGGGEGTGGGGGSGSSAAKGCGCGSAPVAGLLPLLLIAALWTRRRGVQALR